MGRGVRGWAGAGAAVAVALAHVPFAVAQTRACDASTYRLALQALTGPPCADLFVHVTAKGAACELPETFSSIQVALPTRKAIFDNVAAPGGIATVQLGSVKRLQRVRATVSFGAQIRLSGQTRTLLKPDLVLERAYSSRSVQLGRPFFVVAIAKQRTRDVAVTATATVSAAGAVLATKPVRVRPKRRVVLKLPVMVAQLGKTPLTITLTPAAPVETTVRNNVRRFSVETVEFRVREARTLVQSFAGYGSQFNHHVYAAISRSVGVTDANVGDMERKMRALRPEFSRIFFTPQAFTDPDKMQSFIRTVELAQSAGATINITWQGGTLQPQRFADVLIDLVRKRGVTSLRWVTLQNEPNRTRITMQAYEQQYRQLDPFIQSIRGQVKFMGGDLVRGPDSGPPNQEAWFQYFATQMSDILDAYSIHVFWDYWDTQKLVDRLTEVRAIVDALPANARKPIYVTEYGVRGLRTFNGAPAGDPGVWEDGTPLSASNVNAFQHAWFDILAARLGYAGTSKWDSYFGKYDNGTQAYYMIGSPADGWPLYPIYNLMQLMTAAVKTGWRTLDVDGVADTRLLAAYAARGVLVASSASTPQEPSSTLRRRHSSLTRSAGCPRLPHFSSSCGTTRVTGVPHPRKSSRATRPASSRSRFLSRPCSSSRTHERRLPAQGTPAVRLLRIGRARVPSCCARRATSSTCWWSWHSCPRSTSSSRCRLLRLRHRCRREPAPSRRWQAQRHAWVGTRETSFLSWVGSVHATRFA